MALFVRCMHEEMTLENVLRGSREEHMVNSSHNVLLVNTTKNQGPEARIRSRRCYDLGNSHILVLSLSLSPRAKKREPLHKSFRTTTSSPLPLLPSPSACLLSPNSRFPIPENFLSALARRYNHQGER
jgi:hypothetical protein